MKIWLIWLIWMRLISFSAKYTESESSLSQRFRSEPGYLQAREACDPYYVQSYMDKVNEKIGTDYKLFNYYGAADAERIIIAMGAA